MTPQEFIDKWSISALKECAKTPDPREEIGTLRGELATLQAESDRLLDIATPGNRDFVDERLGKIRVRRQDLEGRLADLGRVDYQPLDIEAATRDALAYLARFREVLDEGLSNSGRSSYAASWPRSPSIRMPREARSASTSCRSVL